MLLFIFPNIITSIMQLMFHLLFSEIHPCYCISFCIHVVFVFCYFAGLQNVLRFRVSLREQEGNSSTAVFISDLGRG